MGRKRTGPGLIHGAPSEVLDAPDLTDERIRRIHRIMSKPGNARSGDERNA